MRGARLRRLVRGLARRLPPEVLGVALFLRRVIRRFFAQEMTVYAAALAYRGILALVPATLLGLSLIVLMGLEGWLPRLTSLLNRIRGVDGVDDLGLQGLVSASVVVGLYSMATGSRLFMRALNATHEVEETRPPLLRTLYAVVFLPALALVGAVATLLLMVTSRLVGWVARWFGMGSLVDFLGGWLRAPVAFLMILGAVAAAYHYGPSVRPPVGAVVGGAAVAVGLWALASLGFGFALSTVVDYGATYGGLGAAVSLLVYLHISAIVVLVGAQVSALLSDPSRPDPPPLTARSRPPAG